jgi:hypothetical protein
MKEELKLLEVAVHCEDLTDQGVQRIAKLVRDCRIDECQKNFLRLDFVIQDLVGNVDDLNKDLLPILVFDGFYLDLHVPEPNSFTGILPSFSFDIGLKNPILKLLHFHEVSDAQKCLWLLLETIVHLTLASLLIFVVFSLSELPQELDVLWLLVQIGVCLLHKVVQYLVLHHLSSFVVQEKDCLFHVLKDSLELVA